MAVTVSLSTKVDYGWQRTLPLKSIPFHPPLFFGIGPSPEKGVETEARFLMSGLGGECGRIRRCDSTQLIGCEFPMPHCSCQRPDKAVPPLKEQHSETPPLKFR